MHTNSSPKSKKSGQILKQEWYQEVQIINGKQESQIQF
jgi:hypothetical protein